MAAKNASLSTTIHVLAATAQKTNFFSTFGDDIRNTPLLSDNYSKKGLQDAFGTQMHYLKEAHNKGLMLRIGTDCAFGGKAMLSEMKLLYEYGFSIEDVLQIATLNGAKAMKLDDRFSSIFYG